MATSQQNIQKLLAAGVSQAFIDAELKKGKGGLAKGNNIDDKDVAGFISGYQATPEYQTQQATSAQATADRQAKIDALPDSIKNDPAFKNLPSDMQDIAIYNYEITLANDAVKAKAMADALEQATAQADPYWKEMLKIAQDELTQNITGLEKSYADQEASINERKKQIEEDLLYNKDQISAEQQAALAQRKSALDDELLGVRDAASRSGLSSSSIKTQAENKSLENNKFVVESLQRQTADTLRNLGVTSQRSIESLDSEINSLKSSIGQQETSAIHKAETYLGTENLPELSTSLGAGALGGITGSMYEDKAADINARQDAIYNDLISAGNLNLS